MQFLRYIASGLLNSLIGFGVIAFCTAALAWPPLAANAMGYAAGLGLSYVMHRQFTFRSRVNFLQGWFSYLPVVACAYLVNLGVLMACIDLLHLPVLLSQLLSVGAYVVVGFAGSRRFVFTRIGR